MVAFVAICLLAYVVPGPDWVVVLRRAARSGRAGALAALGVQCGLVVHLAAAVLGVSALVLSSATAFTVLKVVGAAYLIYLGVTALWRARSGAPAADPGAPADTGGTLVATG